MSLPSSYREVKLSRGHLVDRIKNTNQSEWMQVCKRIGLYVAPHMGAGSHCAVYTNAVADFSNPENFVVTLPRNIYPAIQCDLMKKIVFHGMRSGTFSEDDVWRALKVRN